VASGTFASLKYITLMERTSALCIRTTEATAFALLEAWMPSDSKTNEWNLLKHQFDALVYDENVSADSIEEIFDVQFRRRFAELIYRATYRGRRYGIDAA
jgi:hypothetical protein